MAQDVGVIKSTVVSFLPCLVSFSRLFLRCTGFQLQNIFILVPFLFLFFFFGCDLTTLASKVTEN